MDKTEAERVRGNSVLVPCDELARLKDQRDRALALLRECDLLDEPEWNERRLALLAEVDK